mmetsp:Transcript_30430/g.90329  ORF Transcript_30430/g.90329 Transcript_30430/m.90329 type:complete len:229 (+) Transcript_30430:73-759(+)
MRLPWELGVSDFGRHLRRQRSAIRSLRSSTLAGARRLLLGAALGLQARRQQVLATDVTALEHVDYAALHRDGPAAVGEKGSNPCFEEGAVKRVLGRGPIRPRGGPPPGLLLLLREDVHEVVQAEHGGLIPQGVSQAGVVRLAEVHAVAEEVEHVLTYLRVHAPRTDDAVLAARLQQAWALPHGLEARAQARPADLDLDPLVGPHPASGRRDHSDHSGQVPQRRKRSGA